LGANWQRWLENFVLLRSLLIRHVGLIAIQWAVVPGDNCTAASPKDYLTVMPIADADPNSDDRALATSNINAVSIKQGSLVSAGDYQFTSYYGADGKLLIARRNLVARAEVWDILRTQFTSYNIEDRHNTSCIAIDGAGYLHVAWGMHGGGPLLYSRTTTPVVNKRPLHVIGERDGNTGVLRGQVPLQNDTNAITYPQFWKIPSTGDLLLTFRVGSAGNGEWQLARWGNAARAWSSIHTAIKPSDSAPQPWIDNDYSGDNLPNTNAYHNGLVFDDIGRVHVTWTWRTGGDSPSGFSDFQSNHNIMYAYSNDLGISWHHADGRLYERQRQHDIDENNAEPVVIVPEGSSMMNESSATIGSDGHYYLANYWAPRAAEGNHLRQYMLVEYDGAVWRVHQVTNRNTENGNARIPESRLKKFRMSRPIVLAGPANRILLVFSDYQRGGVVTVAYSEDAARTKWGFIDLTSENMGLWEPMYDSNRWKSEGALSMFYEPCGLGHRAATVSVLEWNARKYFASVGVATPNGSQKR
jgi:hypothetical protein